MKKQKNPSPELEPIPRVDEAEFTDVIRKMVNTSPVKRKDVEGFRYQRKKNPHTPQGTAVFDFPELRERKKKS